MTKTKVKHYFKYEEGKANVYVESIYGERIVASFVHGKEAKEYVELKNGAI